MRALFAGFSTNAPDLARPCNDIRRAFSHAAQFWTGTGHDTSTGNPLSVRARGELERGDNVKAWASRE